MGTFNNKAMDLKRAVLVNPNEVVRFIVQFNDFSDTANPFGLGGGVVAQPGYLTADANRYGWKWSWLGDQVALSEIDADLL